MAINQVILIGNLTKDPEVKYGSESQTAYCNMTVAVNRGKDRNGNDMGADFPNIVCFGKTAENCERFLKKGSKVAVQGKVRTDKYENKDGKTVYKTHIFAERIEFLSFGKEGEEEDEKPTEKKAAKTAKAQQEVFPGFAQIDDEDIPF